MSKAVHFDLPDTEKPPSVSVALSGGVDSVVLLHLCLQQAQQGKIKKLRAIHINHNLNQAADEWADFCQKLCKQWSIPLYTKKVQLPDARRKGTERIAREARYQIFAEYLHEGEYLFQGHHQNDQAETVLFRMLRGSDPYGLSAIPQQRQLGQGLLFRPLFASSRPMILEYAEKHHLTWVNDDSNSDTYYARNFIRQRVIPLLQERWPTTVKSLAEVAAQCSSYQTILDEVAQEDLQKVEQIIALPLLGKRRSLCCDALKQLSFEHQINLLKFWFRSDHLPIPNKACLKRIITEMLSVDSDKHPHIHCYGIQIRRYHKWLIIEPVMTEEPCVPATIIVNAGLIILPKSKTPLHIKKSESSSLTINSDIKKLQVTYRPYIQSLAPFAVYRNSHRKSLKKWLNEFQVPQWIRDHIPLLMYQDQLVAIPGLLTNAKFLSASGKTGWKITWQPAASYYK